MQPAFAIIWVAAAGGFVCALPLQDYASLSRQKDYAYHV